MTLQILNLFNLTLLIVSPKLQPGSQLLSKASPDRQHWYGSEEFLALPAQLRKTEMLAMKLESLAQSIPLVSYLKDPHPNPGNDGWTNALLIFHVKVMTSVSITTT